MIKIDNRIVTIINNNNNSIKIMGVKHLNSYFLTNCSKQSIQKIGFEQCRGKSIVIDTSIYLYKFLCEDAYMEQLYLFLTLIHHYEIRPIFIFDGKTPPEKKALVKRRYQEKKSAESIYDQLQIDLLAYEKGSSEFIRICKELEELRKKMMRLKNEHFVLAKQLMDAFGFPYYDAPGEADQLCVYFVQSGKAWACLSDDMDMFLLGCPRVLRSISLFHHTWILYDSESILKDLNMSLQDLIDIVLLSGSDYSVVNEMQQSISLKSLLDIHKNQYVNDDKQIGFYKWYCNIINVNNEIVPTEILNSLFDISTNADLLEPFCKIYSVTSYNRINLEEIKQLMIPSGFIFV